MQAPFDGPSLGYPRISEWLLILFRFEGLSYEAIAALLGRRVSAIASLLWRARQRLRAELKSSAWDVWTGFLLSALPQLPLSLGNSILATRQIATDLFPEKPITVRKIGLTYAAMNLVNPFFGGIPTCHGSGGMAGHYTFGARTGGSVVVYGAVYLIAGLFLSGSFAEVVLLFPKPVLAVILFFEAVALIVLVRDSTASKADFLIVLIVGLLANGLAYGYVIALVVGTVLAHAVRRGVTGLAE